MQQPSVILTRTALRRAVLGVLLEARAPCSISDIVAVLAAAGVSTSPQIVSGPGRVVADLLRYQHRLGRVRRVRRGVYEVVPTGMSAAMRSRCRHWRRLLPAGPDHAVEDCWVPG